MSKTLLKSENITTLTGIQWVTYQRLASDLAENPSKKLSYNQGTLEIMTPLPEHEIHKCFLRRLIQTTTEVLELEILSLGSTTLSREDLQKGIEPDECYYISNEPVIRDQLDFDFTVDSPPDLAIEIDITSSSLNRLTIYESLGIKEIWRFDGRDLFIYCLQDSRYQEKDCSQILPILSKSVILAFLKKWEKVGENAVIQEFRQWLNNNK